MGRVKAFALFALLLSGCYQPPPPHHVCAATQTSVDATADLSKVLAFVENAQADVEANQSLLEASAAARSAIVARRYSDAVAELSRAVRLLEELGGKVPPKVVDEIAAAEVLLAMAGE